MKQAAHVGYIASNINYFYLTFDLTVKSLLVVASTSTIKKLLSLLQLACLRVLVSSMS